MACHRASLVVLVAEDETIVGMALEDALTEAGYTVAGVFGATSAALEWLEDHRVDAAIVDFSLQDGNCVDLLRELTVRGVPIILYSAFNKLPVEFQDVPRIRKPGMFGEVVNALDKQVLVKDTASSTLASKGDSATEPD